MKKKKIIILSILVIFIIAMICGVIWYFNNRNSNYKPNGKLNYDTVLVNEETNPYYQVGFADYVFIGKVDKEIERTFSDYGSARTIYEIEVTENLKGDLQNIIKVTYPGGYDKDGTLILHKGDYITDEELPKIGENYIFVGIGQPNGTILLQDLYSDTPYTEENNKKQELNELDVHTFTIEKVMARRDIEKISIDNGYKEKEFYKFEWDIKTKEEKQQFISKYIDNIVIDKTDTGSLDIKQINFRSSFIDKAVKLTQVGAYDYKLPFEMNHEEKMTLVSSPMKRKQVNKYLGYLREYFDIEYREDKGDRTENDMTIFDSAIPDNYELLKVIPIIDLNLFKGKDITFGLVFRPTIKEIINEK
jgi:hypothetical protein